MERRQFTTRDMFLSVTLIGVGLGCLIFPDVPVPNVLLLTMLKLFLAGSLVGAGIGTPFRAKFAGAAIGLVLAIGFLMVAIEFSDL